ncbi:MAG: nitrate- and nitrite sensing domain-containing protein [Dactylosporangium sp.]|nr:nitrate- and nitrite sensing domain-containing protein [Dactylosporangium sp.]
MRTDRPRGQLRDLELGTKFALVMVVPVTAVLSVATVDVARNVTSANSENGGSLTITLAAEAAVLMHELQNERSTAVVALGSVGEESRDAFEAQVKATAGAVARYQERQAELAEDATPALGERVDRIQVMLADLPGTQEQIIKGPALAITVVTARYTVLIKDLLDIRDEAVATAGDRDLRNDLLAVGALATLKEAVSAERFVVLSMLSRKTLTSTGRRELQTTSIRQDIAKQAFVNAASPWQRGQYNQFVTGPDVRAAFQFRGAVESFIDSQTAGDEQFPEDLLDVYQWDSALAGKSNLLRDTESVIDQRIVAGVGS